jgi:hypothetical protein
VAETPDKDIKGDKQPEPVYHVSRGATATVACLAAAILIAAATANFLPSFDGLSWPSFDRLAFPKLDRLSFLNFNRFTAPKSDRVATQPAQQPPQRTASVAIPEHKPPPAPIPDPVVIGALRDIQSSQKDIQSSQQQNAVVLASLTQSSTTQQNDLKRVSRQLSALAVQVDALNNAGAPTTTGSIPRANPGVSHSNPRARMIRTARRTEKPEPPLPPPVGPVSVGGAPLAPAPATASAAR